MKNFVNWLSLFTASGTLICCAIPSLLVALGMGASLAGFVTNFPQLIWLSQYKIVVFSISGVMLVFAYLMQRNAEDLSCPVDPELAAACASSRKWSKVILAVSIVIWLLGATFAFLLPILNL